LPEAYFAFIFGRRRKFMLKYLQIAMLAPYLCALKFKTKNTMPIKKDGLPFEVHRSPSKNEDGQYVLYATTESERTRSYKEIDNWLCGMGRLRGGELDRALEALIAECARQLGDGYRVLTPLGVFSLKLGLKRELTDPRQVDHDDAEFRAIEFRPSVEFTRMVKAKVRCQGFRYVRKSDSSALVADGDLMERALARSIRSNGGYATVPSFMNFSGLSKYSATKKLNAWCHGADARLRERKVGHTRVYEPCSVEK
jgi:hypothetical protein